MNNSYTLHIASFFLFVSMLNAHHAFTSSIIAQNLNLELIEFDELEYEKKKDVSANNEESSSLNPVYFKTEALITGVHGNSLRLMSNEIAHPPPEYCELFFKSHSVF